MLYLIVFIVAFLLNVYLVIWGKKDLERLKMKIPLKEFIREMEESLNDAIGDKASTVAKIFAILLCVVLVFMNALMFFGGLLAFILGTWTAKRAYQIPAVSNVLNKIACYINRLR